MKRPINAAYLKRQLQLDPRQSAQQIIGLRNTLLGRKSSEGIDPSRRVQRAGEVFSARSSIEQIRSQFWSLPLETLHQQLNAIDLRPYPELANVVDQLKQAASIRTEFPKLAQRLEGNLGLFHCIKQSVTMPPRDVAGMKESVTRSLLAGENTAAYKSAAKIVKEEFPTIYALQPEWIEEIIRTKRLGRDTTARNREFTFGAPNWVFAILLILLLRGCASLLR